LFVNVGDIKIVSNTTCRALYMIINNWIYIKLMLSFYKFKLDVYSWTTNKQHLPWLVSYIALISWKLLILFSTSAN